jgi:ribosome maturation factor RimP
MELKDQVKQALEEKMKGTETFLVDIKASYSKIAVFVDHPKGLKLEDCAEISRYLESKPELLGAFETHELEVSSPGMDEPLKVLKQYEKRIGQEVSILMKDGIRKNGTLKSANENEVVILETVHKKGAGKNTFQTVEHNVAMDEIKETKVVFNFNKILY